MRHGAFLSYSHADERTARWLLQRLEGYRVPKRLGPVFRATWAEARQLLEDDVGRELPSARLDPLVRVLLHLGCDDAARSQLERLERAGYVPLQPFPAGRD